MLQKLCIAFSVLFCFVLQSSIFPHFELAGIVPNLLVILASTYGVMHGEVTGMLVGFCGGLLLDIFFGGLIGFYALVLLLLGFLCGKFCGLFYPEDIRMPLALILLSDFTYGFLVYVFRFLLRARTHFSFYLRHNILPEMLYTILAALVLYPIVLRAYKAFERRKEAAKEQIYA